MEYKFSYPDIPYTVDRELYDYFFSIDRVLRMHGDAINKLLEIANAK